MIRVGRRIYSGGKPVDPTYDDFERIIVMMKSHGKYYVLSPYEIKDENDRILENIYPTKSTAFKRSTKSRSAMNKFLSRPKFILDIIEESSGIIRLRHISMMMAP